jgi:hypothetical protein
MARLPVLTIHTHIESVAQIGFFLGFVTRKSEVDALAPALAARATADATVWFAYPKAAPKRLKCDFNRNTGWNALKAAGFDTVRAVAIDEDWTALRFQRVEYIQSAGNGLRKPTEATEPAHQAAEKKTEDTECKLRQEPCAPRKLKSAAPPTIRI